MRREPTELEILEISLDARVDPEPNPPAPPKSSVWATVALGFAALVVAFQFLPVQSSPGTSIPALPDPAPVTTSLQNASVSTNGSEAEFTWIEMSGLERFETVTAPIETDNGYLTIGNPIGVSRAASVVISDEGAQWNRIGTIHGVGGEVNIVDIDRFQGQLFALGTFTDTMPISDFEPRPQLAAVWNSDDGIAWEMTALSGFGRESFEPWNFWAGDEALLASGFTPTNLREIEAYRNLSPELREEVATGHLRLHIDQLGEVVLTAGPVVVLAEDLVVPPMTNVMHVHRTADGRSWERLDDETIRSGFINETAMSSAHGEPAALLHHWSSETPEQLPQLVGTYLLGEDEEALRVFDLRGEEMGSWSLDQGPVEGHFDSTTRSVTIATTDGQEFVFSIDDLAAYGEFLPATQTTLALSENGTAWRTADVPAPGLVTVIGPLGTGYMLQSRSEAVEGLWPAVYRYLLLVP